MNTTITKTITRLVLGSLFVFASAVAHAVTFTYQEGVNGYVGTRDTEIRSTDSAGNYNYGASKTLNTRYTTGGDAGAGFRIDREVRNILIRFEDLALPAGATINSASITLTISSTTSSNGNALVKFFAYQLLTPWDEGTKAGTSGVANWNKATTDDTWSVAGAKGAEDRNLTPVFESSITYTVGTGKMPLQPMTRSPSHCPPASCKHGSTIPPVTTA